MTPPCGTPFLPEAFSITFRRCMTSASSNRHDYEKEMADAWTKWGAHVCQRRRDHASARRREDASMMTARRSRTGGFFVRHQALVGLSGGGSELARRVRRL